MTWRSEVPITLRRGRNWLALVAACSGFWAAQRLSPDSRQDLALAAPLAIPLILALVLGRIRTYRRQALAALAVGSAAALTLGATTFGTGGTGVQVCIWIALICAALAFGARLPVHLFIPSVAIVLAAILALTSIGTPSAPAPSVQLFASGCSVVILALAFWAWTAESLWRPGAILFASGAITSVLAAIRVERVWLTTTVLLISAGIALVLSSLRTAEPAQVTLLAHLDPDRDAVVAWIGAALLGSALLASVASDSTAAGWPIAGATVIGLAALLLWLRQVAAIEQSRLRSLERAASESRIDALTGLSNRRGIEERLEEEIARARRFGHPLSVLMIDVDDFKQINDRLGHASGDQVLARIAAAIEQSIRSIDTAGRFGGEEFLVILPETPLSGSAIVGNRIRLMVEAGAPPAVSIGAAEFGSTAPTTASLVASADAALYRAKRAGKNRVELSS